ncbi:MAG: transposase, partial [Gammaproteobacteria bacterium]|nr:transposase [Gammaproteobacteria bacterium]
MPTARKYQISLSDTPYYHCMSRCVRRAFLCGEDNLTGKSYQHRKQWVVDKLGQLADVFAIDVCAYAIMSNHSHLVLKINKTKAESWSIDEIIKRWTQLFSAGVLIQRYQSGLCYSEGEINKVYALCDMWRKRLMDISWFMRCLNESIARQANAEDKCTGRFWEGRFKSQALLDEQALLACMVYVDLNPVRAGISQTLEDSDFTS